MEGENAAATLAAPRPDSPSSHTATVVDEQPAAKEEPKIEPGIPLVSLHVPQQEHVTTYQNAPRRRFVIWRYRLWRAWRIFGLVLAGIVRVLYLTLCAVGVAVLACIFIGLMFSFAAANGTVMMLTGNAILRAAHLQGYTGNSEAAAVGAVGGIIATMCTGLVFETCVPKTEYNNTGEERIHAWWVRAVATLLAGTLSGTIGCAVMLRHMDLKGLDVLHATRAGAVGGAIMGPGSIFFIPAVMAVLGIILAPLWIAMAMGVEFIYARTNESWGENWHCYSTCLCYNSCGDPEIDAEVQRVRDIEARHQSFGNQNRRMLGW